MSRSQNLHRMYNAKSLFYTNTTSLFPQVNTAMTSKLLDDRAQAMHFGK